MDAIYAPIELRSIDGAAPRLTGRLMRYGAPGEHGREVFVRGALRWPSNGIRIDLEHLSSPARGAVQIPIMRVVPELRADGGEVWIDAPMPDTAAARDLAAHLRADPPTFAGLSVEFTRADAYVSGGRRHIRSAYLEGAGLVGRPSYTGTSVALRSSTEIAGAYGYNGVRRRIWI
ncbi:MAG: hypothetical protein F4Y14_14680 [Acidobacteria bacterium]|nr:hypothetical protein [Acidobacteriota bacterium]